MKQPETLPFYLQNGDYLDILDNEDVIIATINTHQNGLEVGEYVVKATNNFHKAMELLKWSKSCFSEIQKYKTYGYKFPETATLGHEIEEFLKQVEI